MTHKRVYSIQEKPKKKRGRKWTKKKKDIESRSPKKRNALRSKVDLYGRWWKGKTSFN